MKITLMWTHMQSQTSYNTHSIKSHNKILMYTCAYSMNNTHMPVLTCTCHAKPHHNIHMQSALHMYIQENIHVHQPYILTYITCMHTHYILTCIHSLACLNSYTHCTHICIHMHHNTNICTYSLIYHYIHVQHAYVHIYP